MLIELEAGVEQKAVDLQCVCQKKKKEVATDETNGEQFLVTAVVDFYECQYRVVRIG